MKNKPSFSHSHTNPLQKTYLVYKKKTHLHNQILNIISTINKTNKNPPINQTMKYFLTFTKSLSTKTLQLAIIYFPLVMSPLILHRGKSTALSLLLFSFQETKARDISRRHVARSDCMINLLHKNMYSSKRIVMHIRQCPLLFASLMPKPSPTPL